MTPSQQMSSRPWATYVAILIIAMTLRAPFTAAAPLVGMLGADFHLSTTQIGLLTTLPLLAFALVSPFVSRLAQGVGLEMSLIIGLVVMCLGILLRSLGEVSCLFIGTLLIGCAIAVGNVILPSLLKRDFPHSVASLTGAYSLTMGVAAAIASLLVIPTASLLGWKIALAALIVFPVIALMAWLPRIRIRKTTTLSSPAALQQREIWRSRRAWQITLFLGINSLLYYIMVSWLPALLISDGFSLGQAGSLHGVLQLATAIPGLVIGAIIARNGDQRWLAVGMAGLWVISFIGLWMLPAYAILWISLSGFGSGAAMILGLTLISLRSPTAHQAVALSGMAQSVGYLLAAGGPPVIGMIHDLSKNWYIPLMFCIILASIMVAVGFLAGRAGNIG